MNKLITPALVLLVAYGILGQNADVIPAIVAAVRALLGV